MIINFFLGVLILFFIISSDIYWGDATPTITDPKTQKSDLVERSWISPSSVSTYLSDRDNRVADEFKIAPFYLPNVRFWFLIYTEFGSTSVVVHDRKNLNLVHKVLDFSSLHERGLPSNTAYVLQKKITKEKLEEFSASLDELINDPFMISDFSIRLTSSLKDAKVEIPLEKKSRIMFFQELKNNLRTQTGQRNFIRDGVKRSLPYQGFISQFFSMKKLPTELFAIPFLESSFNPRAHSKVSAKGVWQFMPLIASYYVPKRSDKLDYRLNVGVASVSAAYLMSENYKIMKSWDLAVTAYNSGTKHLLKTKRKLASESTDLELIIKNSDSNHFGFASKNFYSEFLALAHALAYREEVFDDLHESDRPDVNEDLKFFLTKCSVKITKVLSDLQMDDIHYHNHHLDDLQNTLPRGVILTSKSTLPEKYFFKLPQKSLEKLKPKDWPNTLGNQSCSTR